MKTKERDQQLDAIWVRLEELDTEDRAFIGPTSPDNPATWTQAQTEAFGNRFEERKALHEKLRILTGEPIEED